MNTQKRTIELVLRRANTMQENIRKIVERTGCPILAASLPVFRVCPARVGDHKGQPCPCLCLWPFRSAPSTPLCPSPKRPQKCRKSVQIRPGYHPQPQPHQQHRRHSSQKTPHPPLFSQKRSQTAPWTGTGVVGPRRTKLGFGGCRLYTVLKMDSIVETLR